jgi:hypothetical protein
MQKGDERELRRETSDLLETFEKELRGFIVRIIEKHFGSSWFEQDDNNENITNLKKKVKGTWKSSQKSNQKYKIVTTDGWEHYLDFSHYLPLILEYWETKKKPIFRRFFPSREYVIEYLKYLNAIRNTCAHGREIFDLGEHEKIRVYIKDFLKHIIPKDKEEETEAVEYHELVRMLREDYLFSNTVYWRFRVKVRDAENIGAFLDGLGKEKPDLQEKIEYDFMTTDRTFRVDINHEGGYFEGNEDIILEFIEMLSRFASVEKIEVDIATVDMEGICSTFHTDGLAITFDYVIRIRD